MRTLTSSPKQQTQSKFHPLVPVETYHKIVAYQSLATQVGFKDKMPSLPKKITVESLRGFNSRFYNWKSKLLHIERMNNLNRLAIHSERAQHNVIKIVSQAS